MKTTIQNSNLAMLAAAALLLAAPSVRAEDNTGTGGTITYTDSSGLNPAATPYPGGYVVHKFTSSGTLTIPVGVTADVLVVAGGGGGGSFAGGGGAGGLIYSSGFAVSGGDTSVTVGAGGAGGILSSTWRGSAGSNSVFGALIASGGGGGGARDGGTALINGLPGGSGGGGSPRDGAPQGMGGTNSPAGQGYPGGNGGNWGWGGGGGGGAGVAGANASGNNAGTGGNGLAYSISGSSTTYAGGGGGGGYSGGGSAAAGGNGGGGAGSTTANGANGVPNTGGGGGGGAYQKNGGAGGAGIVIVRYPYDPGTFSITLASPANGQSFGSTVSVSTTATVFSGTPPHTVKFYLDSSLVSTTNNAPTTVTLGFGVLALGSHTVEATATDSTSTTVSSGIRTFTVETDTTAPTPNPMTFAIAPGPAGADSIVMTATTATDAWTPPVQYYFENTTTSNNSGWISGTVWTDTGLPPVTVYGYRVKARDAANNETDWSAEAVTMTPGWPATSLYWDGGTAHIAGNGNGASQGGSGTWNTTTQNWDLGTDYPHVAWYNPNNDTAVFGGTAGTVTLGTDITAGGLTFTAAYTLTGGTVTFGAPGTISNSANVTIASVLAGAQPITKAGAGTLTLTAPNTFSGDLVINGGMMDNANVGTFGPGNNITFTGSGTVVPTYGNSPVFAKGVTVNDGATATFNVPNQYYNMTFTNQVAGSGNLVVICSDNGAGSVTLSSAANSLSGTLQVGDATYGISLTVNSWADSANPIKIYGSSVRPAYFTLGAGTASPLLFNSRRIELLGGTGASAFMTNNNATTTNTITINTDLLVSAAGAKTLTLGGTNTGSNTFAGKIADGSGAVISLTKAGSGKWILAGANTYTGNTTVSGGTLVLAAGGGLTFKPTDTTSNKVTGGAAAVFDGAFTIDTSAVSATGSWTLVDVTTKTYGATFSVTGFSGPVGSVWTKVDGARTWTFNTSTGMLAASGPALITSFSIPGYSGFIDNNAMTIVLHLPAGTDLATLAPDFTLSSGTCNQTSGSPPSPTFATQNPVTYTVTDGTTVNHYAVTVTLPVPISYGPTGTGTLAFNTPPETIQWTTASIAGGGGDIGDLTSMDSAVNALAASGITAPVAEIVGNPTGTMPLGKWNSTDKRLTTLPGSNKATCIMATLRNDSGVAVDVFDLSFTLTGSGEDAELPGYVLYYSLTGNAGDWVRIGNLSTPGPVTSTVPLTSSWADGATLHVLWADDNANGVTDSWYGIDNLKLAPPIAVGGYASWQSTNSTSQGLNGDHDQDGVPNGIEYFLGGNTNTRGFTPLPGISNTGGTLSITWTKAADYTGVYPTDFFVETSAYLTGGWVPEALAPAGNVTITGNDVTYTFPSPLGARKFARLKVTGP